MASITVITIIVVAILTALILGLDFLAYRSCLKAYKMEVDAGKHDDEIKKELKPKKKKKGGLVGIICSYAVLLALSALFTTGLIYKARGENLSINGNTALVIKTGSMSGWYDEDLSSVYDDTHFDIGDICIFEDVNDSTEFTVGDIYGYRENGVIITHRLTEIQELGYLFQGDANPISDYAYYGHLVLRENIVYHYTGSKVPGLGAFVLYAQSWFGLWSLVGMSSVLVDSEIVYYKVNSINKERCKQFDDSVEEESKTEETKEESKEESRDEKK